MKIYKIVIFIFAIILILGAVCYFFPPEGIKIGSWELRFASLEKVLTNRDLLAENTEIKEVTTMEETIKDTVLTGQQDSLDFYKNLIENYESRIYLPNNDLTYFNSFFAKAASAKAQGKTVRVLHYGDSQIEMDRITSNLRRFFQGKFGGSGPGLVPVQPTIGSSTFVQGSGDLTLYSVFGPGKRDSEKKYGILTKFFRMHSAATCKINRTSTNHVRLIMSNRGNFTAVLSCGEYEEEKSCDSIEGFHVLDWHLPQSMTGLTLKMTGAADLYGIMIDNGSGVAVDNIPMRGSSGTVFSGMNSALLQQSYSQTNVGMIILQYGGNSMPAIYSKQQVDGYAASMGRQIRFLKQIYPNTPILFIGPSDMSHSYDGIMQSYKLMEDMVNALKEAALSNGAAFWNIYEVMGGHNSMLAWVHQGLAGGDYVHFTPAGANKVGGLLVDAFSTIFDYYSISH